MKYIILSLMALTLLNSCATLNKEDCQQIDLLKRGKSDASSGENSQFEKYQSQCQAHGIALTKTKYDLGYERGLKDYCNYDNGLKRGLNGEEPFLGCKKFVTNFYRGYEKGFGEYEVRQEEDRKDKLREEARKELVNRYHSKECNSDSDCNRNGDCSFGECRHDGSSCRFNSDCKVAGDCRTESTYASRINEWVEARICKE